MLHLVVGIKCLPLVGPRRGGNIPTGIGWGYTDERLWDESERTLKYKHIKNIQHNIHSATKQIKKIIPLPVK